MVVLEKILQAAKENKIEFTIHGAQQVDGRNVTTQDIRYAILNYILSTPIENTDKLNIYGPLEHKEFLCLMISCTYFEGVLVITTHKISKKRVLKHVQKRS